MNFRRARPAVLLLAGGLVAIGVTRYVLQRAPSPAAGGEEAASTKPAPPVARVRVAPVRRERITETLTLYGIVEAPPGETLTISVPYECRVGRVLVVSGQPLAGQEPLVEVEPSPESRLLLEQARQDLDSATRQAKITRQRLEMKLATQQEILQAEQTQANSELRVRSLEQRGIDGRKTLSASGPGIVSRIDVQQGQIVPAGGALLETAAQNQIMVRLGLENEDARRVHIGQPVRIDPVNGHHEIIEGKVRMIAGEVNPQTRLVNLFVTPASDVRLFLNEYVRGRLEVASDEGLVVSPQALLPQDGAHVLYTVQAGHAARHIVKVGIENDTAVELLDTNVQPGQLAVIEGNSELEDGMAVEVEPDR